MLSFLFQCVVCKSEIHPFSERRSFPLCPICITHLVHCPPLCSSCGSPLCLTMGEKCSRPWIQRPQIQSYSALYLLVDPCYQILKKWKKNRGTLFDRIVLNSNPLGNLWNAFQADAIVPIPQRFLRAWEMGGSCTERIAQWVSKETGLPLIRLLRRPFRLRPGKRQAELKLQERLQTTFSFEVDREEARKFKRVILIDDFITTGRTIDLAAKSLKEAGTHRIHVFCLGLKATRIYSESSPHLVKSPGRSISIG